jgi:hypothetical protein
MIAKMPASMNEQLIKEFMGLQCPLYANTIDKQK